MYLCWIEEDNDFQQALLKLIVNAQLTGEDSDLRRDVLRLLVSTFIVGHVLNVSGETKESDLSKMQAYEKNAYARTVTVARLANRQLKYFFSHLQQSAMARVIEKIQQLLKSPQDEWVIGSIMMIGVCMALEETQMTVHLIQSTKAARENLGYKICQA